MEEETKTVLHIIVSDDDAHYYVIPKDEEDNWYKFLNSEAAEDGDLPYFAYPIGGALSRVSFGKYNIE